MKAISLPWLLKPIQRVDFPHKLGVCERLFRNRLAREGICWVQTGARIPWKLDLVNSTHRWIVYGKYEGSGFLNWARKFLPRDGIVVDAGANVGQMLVYIAQWVPQGKVLAFEPGRKQADWLRECLAFHNELPVEIIRCGLGAGPAMLYLRDEGAQLKHGAQSYVSEIDGEPIKIVRLADELTTRSIENVDLWKLDVEGYELPALKGAEELLGKKRVKSIYVEMLGDNSLHIQEYLSAFGYSCFHLDRSGRPYISSTPPKNGNGLFLIN